MQIRIGTHLEILIFYPDPDPDFHLQGEVFLNVLLVEQKGQYYERLHLCEIELAAWLAADPQPAFIKLA
jgi:hypothetical protein